MVTSSSKTRTGQKAVCVDQQQELEIRFALYEFYGRQLEIMNTKVSRIKRFRNDLKASSVSLHELLNNPLLDEDRLDWLIEAPELYAYPTFRRKPRWVRKFERSS